jgi:probable rRNA maturation factor
MHRIQLSNHTHYKIQHNTYIKMIENILSELGYSNSFVSMHFLTAPKITELHQQYFYNKAPTDCITLPVDHEGESGLNVLGDGFLCLSYIKSNALYYGVTFKHEIVRCMCHCILHMIGYEDKTPEQQKIMTEKENELLKKINIQ